MSREFFPFSISLWIVVKLAADEVLRIEDGFYGIHHNLVLRGVTDETLGIGGKGKRGR